MNKLTDADEITFGKHKGEKLGDVPASYLVWCYEDKVQENDLAFRDYLERNIRALLDEAKDDKYIAARKRY